MGKMNILIRCFGCTANFGEAAQHMKMLKKAGHIIVNDASLADIAIIRTCCVIERTELNMLREITSFTKRSIPVIVTGCMASSRRVIIEERFPKVVFCSFGEEAQLPEMIESLHEDSIDRETTGCEKHKIPGSEMGTLLKSNIVSPAADELSTTHIEVISNGCLGKCSYCITRFARGQLESYSREKIRSGINKALGNGKKEIFLTSQDNAVYGFDFGFKEKKYYLPSLLNDILKDNSDYNFRLRVGMMNPWGLARIIGELIPVMNNKKIYSFIHLPVQSGDHEVLVSMRRRYKRSDFVDLVSQLRQGLPELTLSTDIIVGFPGENEEQFARSFDLMKEIEPDVINITRFSPRPGTVAASMKNRIVGWKAKNRSRELTKLRFDITDRKLSGRRGTRLKALSVEAGTKNSTLLRTDNYTTVVVKEDLPLGIFFDVEIIDSTDIYLVGKVSS
jgi:MiaB-like tRNA modifying enzyme